MKLAFIIFLLLVPSAGADAFRVVMWSFPIRGRALVIPVELKTDYGYMVINTGTMETPSVAVIISRFPPSTIVLANIDLDPKSKQSQR